jgi:hypothetical protein
MGELVKAEKAQLRSLPVENVLFVLQVRERNDGSGWEGPAVIGLFLLCRVTADRSCSIRPRDRLRW